MLYVIRVLAITSVLAWAAPAMAESDLLARTLTAEDRDRLSQFDAVRKAAIASAMKGGDASAGRVLDEVLEGEPQPILGVDIRGEYRCRVTKLDGILPLVIYDWFRCAITEDDIGYRLDKMSGSQRLSGHFIDDREDSLVFFGASHMGDERPSLMAIPTATSSDGS